MKIIALELFHISIPFLRPYKLSKLYGEIPAAQAVIFKIHTDDGLVGLGEAAPMPPFTDETAAGIMAVVRDYLAPLLLGRNPLEGPVLEAALDRIIHGNLLAKGALSMALSDLQGKAFGLPVHSFLGGRLHEHLPLLLGIGSGTPDEDAAAIEELLELGIKTVMLKMGARPIAQEIERVRAAEKRFGDELKIIADANQGWEVFEALELVRGLTGSGLRLLEQPIKRGDLAGFKRIRSRADFPLSADESLVTIQDAADLIREEAVDVFSLKVSKNGGPTRAGKIARTAEAFGLKCLMNSMLEFGVAQAASLHLGCTLPNLIDLGQAYGSVLRMSDDVTDFGQNIDQGLVRVPSGPGLGVKLDEDKLKAYTRNTYRLRLDGTTVTRQGYLM